jgi:hypothetical protein
LASARTVSSSRDFGVEQFFRADEFRADDPSPSVRFIESYPFGTIFKPNNVF